MIRHIVAMMLVMLPLVAAGQTSAVTNIRYVCNHSGEVTYTEGGVEKTGYHVKGKYENDGRSWATAKENIQDAINDLIANKQTGEVWVAEGTYKPTESTESTGGSTLYMSFKIPAGITVRGGFKGMLTESAVPTTAKASDDGTQFTYTEEVAGAQTEKTVPVGYAGESLLADREMISAKASSIGESTKYRTVLTGSLDQDPDFQWDEHRQTFVTQFYGNCYHVVTFATNGFDSDGRAKALVDGGVTAVATTLSSQEYVAKLEGVVVMNGNAHNAALDGHPHNAYGGGIYMVPGSMVENVYVTNCEASRDGGAIYMDGGGIVRHCYIANCQALGVGLNTGFGGGLCIDENKQIYPPQVTRATVTNCVGRYGGGMASRVNNPTLKYVTPSKTYDMRYNIGVSSNLITNCVATTEGGGVYSYQGGSWTHMTVVNNRCNGTGLTVNGMKTGASAGLYVRDAAIVANSIFWGGTTQSVNDESQSPQVASSRSKQESKFEFLYSALSNADYVDWSGTKKANVIKLSSANRYSDLPAEEQTTQAQTAHYAAFLHPSTTVGYEENGATKNYLPYEAGSATKTGYSYKVAYSSSAAYAGVLTTDLDVEKKTPAKPYSYDIQGEHFSSFPTLGAYVSNAPSMAPSIEWTGTTTVDGNTVPEGTAHVYVDPNAPYFDHEEYAGSSWATPIKNLRDALTQIEEKLPGLLGSRKYVISKIQVHVKEGTVDLNGSQAMGGVRDGSLVVPSTETTPGQLATAIPIEILGGYDQSLTYDDTWATQPQTTDIYRQGHDLTKRNPVLTPTIVTGAILSDYQYYAPHLLRIEGRKGVTIDGFQLRYANASSTTMGQTNTNGGAITVTNSQDVTLRNVLVAGCTAGKGAALYATNGSTVTMENCIVHNNETGYDKAANNVAATAGNIYIDATSTLSMDHCDVLRNVGYGVYAETGATVKMTNSVVYGNMSQPVPDTNSYGVSNDGEPANKNDRSVVAIAGGGEVTGDHNYFDLKSRDKAPMTSLHLEPWLQFNFDGGSNTNYPFFCNPTKNAGVSVTGDDTYYGRATSFQPHNGNPMVNTASKAGTHDTWGTDMSTTVTRDYGGLPDVGAIENHQAIEGEGTFAYADGFPAYGTHWYVRDYGTDLTTDGRDGMSWETAINGNALYEGKNGLQYAVDLAHEAFVAAGGTLGDEQEVWVGAGTYSKDNDTGEASCFVIRDGVNVYGAFPKDGNPGKEQREPLCSQYVKETKDRTVANYETILQPKTASTAAGTTHRVLGQPYASNPVNGDATVTYHGAEWDGFTLRNGVLDAAAFTSNSDRQGGAAAAIYTNVILRNVVATNNTTFFTAAEQTSEFRGGGIYIDGGTMEESYAINNKLEARDASNNASTTSGHAYGGGVYMYQGSVYNSVIANNAIKAHYASGAGTAIYGEALPEKDASGKFIVDTDGHKQYAITTNFFNNTVVNNKAEGDSRKCGGVAMVNATANADEFDNHSLINVYNCIVTGNTGYVKGAKVDGYPDFSVQINGRMQIHNCATPQIVQYAQNQCFMSFTDCYKIESTANIFENYNSTQDFALQDLRLKSTATSIINSGISAPNVNGSLVNLESYTDMDNNDRILDCTVDMGAFEYNNSYSITPDITSEPGRAIYYVTPEGRALASANTPGNAACASKLQKVLDAAGRYKYQLLSADPTDTTQVVVKVATRKVGNKTDYVKPGVFLSTESSKRDLANVKEQKAYIYSLDLDVKDPQGNTTTVTALSGLTEPQGAEDFYVLGTQNINVYAGQEVTFHFNFPQPHGGTGSRAGKDCLVESFWIDTNGDKIFNSRIKQVGAVKTWNANALLETATVKIPDEMTGDPTRIRIRLETPWQISYNDANMQTNRMVYDIPITVVNGTTSPSSFQYYANRTVEEEDQDIRMWSIVVPRGVEVWGGYSDKYTNDNDNGFCRKATQEDVTSKKATALGEYLDLRDILGNPVYFDASYYNKVEGTNAVTYHVVSFADRVFDGNGNAYHEGDEIGKDAQAGNSGNPLLTMTEVTQDRAVVDGIFIQGGVADANAGVSSGAVNVNQYGGAAIVTDYAHVRNCIVRDNKGIYGGAFALTHGALISGTLIEKNQADYGGAVYVFENGEKLSDGTEVSTGTTAADCDKMPHIYTSTIVNNTAQTQGGGVWFSEDYPNVRLNSVALWRNNCNDEANVYGAYAPSKADDDNTKPQQYYPFAYSAVENMRMVGTNNIRLETHNSNGARFAKADATDNKTMATATDLSDYGYYQPTAYSVLLRCGMPVDEYDEQVATKQLAPADFKGTNREAGDMRSYVDIGALALDKKLDVQQLMLRLFVARPEDVDMNAAQTMMNLDVSAGTDAEKKVKRYYNQEGSSFAYPFQSLQDALDYIVFARSWRMKPQTEQDLYLGFQNASEMPFEICVAKGTYYPTKDVAGHYGESLSNTFAIPEGVSIYGGFNARGLTGGLFYGAYATVSDATSVPADESHETPYDLSVNTETPEYEKATLTNFGPTYKILSEPIRTMLFDRVRTDVNGNSIIEPWEFEYETVLSGNSTNEVEKGVYHVVTIVPDENVVGVLPTPSLYHNHGGMEQYQISGREGYGYTPYEYGQGIHLDGLSIVSGNARHYSNADMDELSKYSYYKGGAILVDGNRYCNSSNRDHASNYQTVADYNAATGTTITEAEFEELKTATYQHKGVMDAVAYRDIALSVAQCRFRENVSGVGGAIYSDSDLDVYSSSFENNMAIATEETSVEFTDHKTTRTDLTVKSGGQGGALYCTSKLMLINTLLANNEAKDEAMELALQAFPNLHNQMPTVKTLGGCGGAVYMGSNSNFHITNCNFVRNRANVYPALFTMNPNTLVGVPASGEVSYESYNQLDNSVAWGNDLQKAMVTKYSGNIYFRFAAPLLCNYGRKDRVDHHSATDYSPEFCALSTGDLTKGVPTSQDELDQLMETAYFCAYEQGRGITPSNPADLRGRSIPPTKHMYYVMSHFKALDAEGNETETLIPYQNSNILIDSENATLEGPNFGSPSLTAGCDGFTEDADWSPSRITNMTDRGSGVIHQTISNGVCTFDTYKSVEDLPARSIVRDPVNGYTSEDVGDIISHGIYPGFHFVASEPNNAYNTRIGDKTYMRMAATGEDILRISYDPNPTHNQTYIDIGVYEYVHEPLKPAEVGDEVDILWVSVNEKHENGRPDGHAWTNPTSDLQRAIETLLASRNGHRKEIRLMDGEYTPIYTINDHLAFYIDTKYLNSSAVLPTDEYGTVQESLGVKSFTIKGGYSKELNGQRDVDLYPSVIRGKARTATTGDQWNHTIYIADATQRYGYSTGYVPENGYGWWETAEKQASKPNPEVIPMEIDGVTVCNDQVLGVKDGAAICYADQTFDATCTQTTFADGQAPTYIGTVATTANITTVASDEKDDHRNTTKDAPAKLIVSKCNVYGSGSPDNRKSGSAVYVGKYGGSSLLFNNVLHSNYGKPLVAYGATTINNTFALNYGPVELKDYTQDINGDGDTSDANEKFTSLAYNSVFWRNNPTGTDTPEAATSYDEQFTIGDANFQGTLTGTGETATISGLTDNFQRNAYTGGNCEAIAYEVEGGTTNIIQNNRYNVGLVYENTDAIYGPNFEDPLNVTLSERSFMLKPSLRLLNKGDNLLYQTVKDNATAFLVYDYAWIPSVDEDASGGKRVMSGIIDLGALEYQTRQNRILYVDLSKTMTGEGLSWGDALPYGSIQSAIDLGAVYYKNKGEQAYVFVKVGSSMQRDLHSGESLTLRNGVSVYGSVNNDFKENCPYRLNALDEHEYDEALIEAYVAKLTMYKRDGVIKPNESHTRVYGINTNGTAFTQIDGSGNGPIALIDGFEVTNKTDQNPTGEVSAPVINITPNKNDVEQADGKLKMCLRNILVHDNDYSSPAVDGESSLVYVNSALLYEVLMYDNKVATGASVLKVGEHGYVVNATVEGRTTDATGSSRLNNVDNTASGTSAISGNTASSHVYNSLTNYMEDEQTYKTLSSYCYKTEESGLNYQLTEHSPYIDAIEARNPFADGGIVVDEPTRKALGAFINYDVSVYTAAEAAALNAQATQYPLGNVDVFSVKEGDFKACDRDLLGNFRLQTLSGNFATKHGAEAYTPKIDRGAFETWKVVRNTECVFPDYPHDGTCEYIMEGKSLIIDAVMNDGDPRSTAHVPGFVLLQKGASLYGNGRPVWAGYVAVEREIPSDKGAVVALPYALNYKSFVGTPVNTGNTTVGAAIRTYDDRGIMTLTEDKDGSTLHDVYRYDGSRRSAYDYQFADATSACWRTMDVSEQAAASQGVLYVPAKWAAGNVYRFTARGETGIDYVYQELEEHDKMHYQKTLTLTQYNDVESTGGGADFTSHEDMGWNCIGMPYLVSDYKPYQGADGATYTSGAYMMDLPHDMWLFYDGVTTPKGGDTPNGNGGFYSVPSYSAEPADWHMADTATPAIWVGEGLFVQTATLEATEELTFHRPVPPTLGGAAPVKKRVNARYYLGEDEAEEMTPEGQIGIRVEGRTIIVTGLTGEDDVELYRVSGVKYDAARGRVGECRFRVQPGAYVVRVGSVARKVVVF